MKLTQNVLESYSKFIAFENEDQSINEFKGVLQYGMRIICEHLNMNFEYEIETFGAVQFNTLISQYEPISFAIKIYDATIFDNVQKCIGTTVSKKKKASLVTTESIKLLLSIYLEKYFEDVGNVTFSRNCLNIDSQNLFQFNSNVYIFASNFSQNLSLDDSLSKILSVDFDKMNANFTIKVNETDCNYIRVVNIIKNLCEKSNLLQNPLLIETLVYNVPKKYLKEGDLREQVIKSLIFIKFSNLSKFDSLTNSNEKMEKDYFILPSIYNVYKDLEILTKSLI